MDQALIKSVVDELRTALNGRYCGKIYQLGPLSFAIDFGLRGEFLFISVDPSNPRFYLIRRRTKDLEKQSTALNSFGQTMRSRLSGAHVVNISKDPLDRIVRLTFRKEDVFRRLVIQLTGRTADVFLLDELNRIDAILREQAQTRIHQFYERSVKRNISRNSLAVLNSTFDSEERPLTIVRKIELVLLPLIGKRGNVFDVLDVFSCQPSHIIDSLFFHRQK